MPPESIDCNNFLNQASSVAQIATALTGIFGLISIYFLIRQLSDTRKWNKLHLAFSFYSQPSELESLEHELDQVTQLWRRTDPFTSDEVSALLGKTLSEAQRASLAGEKPSAALESGALTSESVEMRWCIAGRKLRQYLNLIEMYACAVNSGVADSDTAKMIYGFKFCAHFRKSKPYIEQMRIDKNDDSLFCEVEKLVETWNPTRKPESATKKY